MDYCVQPSQRLSSSLGGERRKAWIEAGLTAVSEEALSGRERGGEEAAERPSRDLLLLGVGRGESQSSTRQETRQTRRGGGKKAVRQGFWAF